MNLKDKSEIRPSAVSGLPKSEWRTPQLTRVGTMAAIVRPGNGKSVSGGDPGDYLEPRGQH